MLAFLGQVKYTEYNTINTIDIYTAVTYQFHRGSSHYLVLLISVDFFLNSHNNKPHLQNMLISNNIGICYQLVCVKIKKVILLIIIICNYYSHS